MTHTPEPWQTLSSCPWEISRLNAHHEESFATTSPDLFDRDRREAEADAARIVACVNACSGMIDPPAAIAALRAELLRVRTTGHGAAHELDNIAVECGLGHSPAPGAVSAYVRGLREQMSQLLAYVDGQNFRSDFRSATEMRTEIERLRYELAEANKTCEEVDEDNKRLRAALKEAAATLKGIAEDHWRDGYLCTVCGAKGGCWPCDTHLDASKAILAISPPPATTEKEKP